MKSVNKLLVVVLGLALVTGVAEAAGKRVSRYQTPYGMGGCGLGSMLINNKGQWPQVGVSIINQYFGQTFAITSGTSNCVQRGSMAAVENEQEVFVQVNLPELQKEAARGQGEHLEVLAEIFGCQSKEAFAQMSQNRYEAIFTNENPSAVVDSYKSELKNNKLGCTRAG